MSSIVSEEENKMIKKMFKSDEESHFWVGGYRKVESEYFGAEWAWCDSNKWGYSNWASTAICVPKDRLWSN